MASKAAIEVGVVGCSGIAQIVHLPILEQLDGATVTAVCDVDVAKAKTVGQRFGVAAAYPSIEALLEHPDLDAVIVCTPNHLHARHTELALQAGLHVLCERPLGTSREQVSRTLGVARQAGRSLMIENSHRFRPDAWALRRSVSNGQLGEIFHMHASWQRRRARRPRTSEWRLSREYGGGALMDLGVTNLDFCLWLLGYPAPERLTAYLPDRDADGVEDTAVVLMRLERDVTCSVEVTWDLAAAEDQHSFVALGAAGFGSLYPFVIQRMTPGGVVDVTPRLAPGTENIYRASYRRELGYFISVVQGEREEPLPEEQEVLLSIVEACYRSAEEGREILL
jgi:predicted dehydrogenase